MPPYTARLMAAAVGVVILLAGCSADEGVPAPVESSRAGNDVCDSVLAFGRDNLGALDLKRSQGEDDERPIRDRAYCVVSRPLPDGGKGMAMIAELRRLPDFDPDVPVAQPEGWNEVPGFSVPVWERISLPERQFRAVIDGWHGSLALNADGLVTPSGPILITDEVVKACIEFLIELIRSSGAWK
ncbi:hypothetical protein APR12_006318 [Nocardia amikacinitolerans]|nr:hypothetical protein [Nocardia amikacinitolerans]